MAGPGKVIARIIPRSRIQLFEPNKQGAEPKREQEFCPFLHHFKRMHGAGIPRLKNSGGRKRFAVIWTTLSR